jgi:hypothetical protein
MAKYRKTALVDGDQYTPGMEDGFDIMGNPIIKTLEGNMIISPTDWILTGVKGERFNSTYEKVEE